MIRMIRKEVITRPRRFKTDRRRCEGTRLVALQRIDGIGPAGWGNGAVLHFLRHGFCIAGVFRSTGGLQTAVLVVSCSSFYSIRL